LVILDGNSGFFPVAVAGFMTASADGAPRRRGKLRDHVGASQAFRGCIIPRDVENVANKLGRSRKVLPIMTLKSPITLPTCLRIWQRGKLLQTHAEAAPAWPATTFSQSPTPTRGAKVIQMYALSVRANSPPTVSPIPSGSVILGLTYRYDVQASDPDGDPLTYAFTASPNNPPTGMTIDPGTGRITWTPSATGTSSGFSVVATDPYGASSTPQAISITVSADTTAPNVELQYSPTAPAVGT